MDRFPRGMDPVVEKEESRSQPARIQEVNYAGFIVEAVKSIPGLDITVTKLQVNEDPHEAMVSLILQIKNG